jgi:transposase InsO family protein
LLEPTSRKAGRALRSDPYTYVPIWSGMVYVFVIDAYARRILGWRAVTMMTTALVLDALDQAVWTRHRDGIKDLAGLSTTMTPARNTLRSRSPTGSPKPASTPRRDRSVTYDNALAETVIGLFENRADQAPRSLAHRRVSGHAGGVQPAVPGSLCRAPNPDSDPPLESAAEAVS